MQGIRKGRGNRRAKQSFQRSSLLPRHQLLAPASSKSTLKNLNRVRSVFPQYAAKHKSPDPKEVNNNSSVLVLNFLAEYCDLGGDDMLKNDSMGAIVQGLRHLYEESGHCQSWKCDEKTGIATGNPLIGNPDLVRLRRAHRVVLAKRGDLSLKARPITAAHVCQHAEQFWFGSSEKGSAIDARDVALHAVLVVGLNMGMRFDEIAKLNIEHVSLSSDSLNLTLTEAIKNSTEQRTYSIRNWPGNTDLRFSIYMDPFLALSCWLLVRGIDAGPLFCDIRKTKGASVIDTSKSWTAGKFKDFLRGRLHMCGVGKGDLEMYSGHSIKRGAVQLYRSLGLRDEFIMEIIQMKGDHAYANYTAAYNDCCPQDLPRFANKRDFISHAQTISLEKDNIQSGADFDHFWSVVLDGKS